MPEHRIRLRIGWECHYREGDDEETSELYRRVDLPVPSVADFPLRFRLTRQFGRPPVDPRNESLTLEMRNVAGLKSARLNGRPIAANVLNRCDMDIELSGTLLPRNGLVLEIALGESVLSDPTPWGIISLVIRPR